MKYSEIRNLISFSNHAEWDVETLRGTMLYTHTSGFYFIKSTGLDSFYSKWNITVLRPNFFQRLTNRFYQKDMRDLIEFCDRKHTRKIAAKRVISRAPISKSKTEYYTTQQNIVAVESDPISDLLASEPFIIPLQSTTQEVYSYQSEERCTPKYESPSSNYEPSSSSYSSSDCGSDSSYSSD